MVEILLITNAVYDRNQEMMQGRHWVFGLWHKKLFSCRSHVVRASRSDGSLCLITLKVEF